jgi:hypothetical protein
MIFLLVASVLLVLLLISALSDRKGKKEGFEYEKKKWLPGTSIPQYPPE